MSLFAKFFHIVELEKFEDRVHPAAIPKILKIGFILGFLAANLITYYAFGPGADFIIPTGLSATKIAVVVFLLMLFYNSIDNDIIIDLDKKYDLGLIYHEDIHEEYAVKKWGVEE